MPNFEQILAFKAYENKIFIGRLFMLIMRDGDTSAYDIFSGL